MSLRMPAVLALLVLGSVRASTQPAAAPPGQDVTPLLRAIEKVAASGQPDDYTPLLSPAADRAAALTFARAQFARRFDRVAVRELDRAPLPGGTGADRLRVIVEVLFETGGRGRLATWQLDVTRATDTTAASGWHIDGQRQLSSLENLYRLALNTTRQIPGAGLVITAPDVRLTLDSGAAFTADDGDGETAIVLVGKGEMTFTPGPPAERGQVAIFSGSETLRARFDTCVVRVNPADLPNHLARQPAPEPVDARLLQRAQEALASASPFFAVDLHDLSPGSWSVQPAYGDFVAEVRTSRFGTLTYSRSMIEPEDIGLFDRAHRRYVALYGSPENVAARGRFYVDDGRADYDALHYDVTASFMPEREWLEGRTRVTLRVRAPSVSSLQVRLADDLAVRSAILESVGRVVAVRARGRDAVIVSLPEPLPRGAVVTLAIAYAGRLSPQSTQPVVASADGSGQVRPPTIAAIEPTYLYSAATPWYAQAPVNGFATATLHLTVPAEYGCVASGALVSTASVASDMAGAASPGRLGSRPGAPAADASSGAQTSPDRTEFVFEAARPVRYLACLIGRFQPTRKATIALSDVAAPGAPAVAVEAVRGPSIVVSTPQLDGGRAADARPGDRPSNTWPPLATAPLTVVAGRDEQAQSAEAVTEAQDVVRFYTSIIGDYPYPALTVALLERDLPGGHSPAYLAILDRQAPGSRLVWRDDPASFRDFPDFFVAHELAHQWWGQAVGVKNYHEEWLSEGFAQYFAALYAEHAHGRAVFDQMMRQMQRWTLADSAAGPVYLGDRVGAVQNDGRLLRAVVYDKAAVVLQMLRRLVGDRAFFAGLRRYYATWRFKKAGTDDLRKALEAESGMQLERFFERWVYEDTIPTLKFSSRVERTDAGDQVVVRFEQPGEIFDLPVTVTIDCAGRAPVDLVVPVTDRVTERRFPVQGRVKNITANRDGLAPVKITR